MSDDVSAVYLGLRDSSQYNLISRPGSLGVCLYDGTWLAPAAQQARLSVRPMVVHGGRTVQHSYHCGYCFPPQESLIYSTTISISGVATTQILTQQTAATYTDDSVINSGLCSDVQRQSCTRRRTSRPAAPSPLPLTAPAASPMLLRSFFVAGPRPTWAQTQSQRAPPTPPPLPTATPARTASPRSSTLTLCIPRTTVALRLARIGRVCRAALRPFLRPIAP